jgi:alkyl hydroperoxide reductase subunit AhpC
LIINICLYCLTNPEIALNKSVYIYKHKVQVVKKFHMIMKKITLLIHDNLYIIDLESEIQVVVNNNNNLNFGQKIQKIII